MRKYSKYIILRGLEHGNVFWTMHKASRDETKLADGTVAYEIMGFANTSEEAIAKCKELAPDAIADFIDDLMRKIN